MGSRKVFSNKSDQLDIGIENNSGGLEYSIQVLSFSSNPDQVLNQVSAVLKIVEIF